MSRIVLGLFVAALGQCVQAEEPSKLKTSTECVCVGESEHAAPMEQSLKNLEAKLNLTEQQRSLWLTWSTQLLAAHHTKDEFNRTAVERRKLPAPERQQLWMTSAETHLKSMRDSLPALKAFYGSLNDQQKAAFDSEVPFQHSACGVPGQKPSHCP